MSRAEAPRQQAAAPSVVMGTAGHIDHGKTALVLALTGTDTDRLPEEKTRGITIDLGFASLDLTEDGRTVHLGLVDVPGHHAFIHNMLAGAGGIDAVMLVIAADEGVKAQTVEHLAICALLGVRHGLIALTKKDAVNAERLQQARSEIGAFAQGTFLASAPVIAVSAITGEGIAELKKALFALALQVPAHSHDTLLRLPLDRAFSVAGFGTVVTGTLRDGSVQVGDSVELQPEGRVVRVRGVQVHHQQVKEAHAATRVALNLAGLEVADARRGDMVVQQGTLTPTGTLDVELTILPGARALKHRARVGVHAFTSEAAATVLLYGDAEANADGSRLARLRVSKPMLLLPGDRFVLRQLSPAEIVGGGRVLDAHPLARLRKAAAHAWLQEIRNATGEQQLLARVRRRGLEGLSLALLMQETGLRAQAIRNITDRLVTAGALVRTRGESPQAERLITPAALEKAAQMLLKDLERKEAGSGSRAELLSRTRMKEWVFNLALERLAGAKKVRVAGSDIAIENGEAPGARQTELLARVESLYRGAGLAPPLVAEAAVALKMAAKDLTPLLTQLLRSGKLLRMGSDTLLMHADAVGKLKADLAKLRGQTMDVGRFKELTGLTRKHAIPLLEFLDRARVTANQQGTRKIL